MTNDYAGPRAIGSTKLIYGMEITYREEAVGNRAARKEIGERKRGRRKEEGGEKEEELRIHMEEGDNEKKEARRGEGRGTMVTCGGSREGEGGIERRGKGEGKRKGGKTREW
jgi:hypothetical protein